ncbi:hypothetical protein Aduo_016110 [Ancylostoma duodenale]
MDCIAYPQVIAPTQTGVPGSYLEESLRMCEDVALAATSSIARSRHIITSFASFVSTDSFNFSADFMFGPITKEDEGVNQSCTVWTWHGYWEGSSLRVNHVRHKVRREEEARLVRDAGTVKKVVEDSKDAKKSDEEKKAAPTEESTAAELPGGRRSSRLVALASKRVAAPYDTTSPSSARPAKRCAASRK